MADNNPLSYDFSGPSLTQGPSREEQVAQQRALNRARMDIAVAVSPISLILPSSETSLPAAGSIAGGLLPVLFPESRPAQALMQLGSKAPAAVRPFVPSLAGSSAGVAAGTLAEQSLLPDQELFSSETGQKLLGNLIENAAFDVGGNLAFSVGGKVIQVGKDALAKMGVGKGGLMSNLSEDAQARLAAQKWLSSRGATLTKGQLTGDTGTQAVEGALSVSSGGSAFEKQRKGVEAAIRQGSQDVMSSLDTSDAFKMALKQGDPTQMAVGDRFKNAVKVAEQDMKEKYRPVYQQLEQEGDGLFVNMKPIKDMAKQELDKLAKQKFAGAGRERADVLEQILAQNDEVPLSVAHGLRSDLLSGARDLQKEGVATTTKEREYTIQAANIAKQMDSVMVATFGNEEEKALARKLGMGGGIDQASGLRKGEYKGYYTDLDKFLETVGKTPANTANNKLLRDYFNAQKGYSDAMQGFYNGTVSSALKQEPSAVGEYLFNMDRPERMRDAFKAIVEVQKNASPEVSKGMAEELMYGFLRKAMATPDDVLKFSKLLDNPQFKENFDFLFRDTTKRKQIEDVFKAAKYGFEETPGGTFLRTKLGTAATGVGTTAAAGGLLYYTMPDEVKNKLDLPQELAGLTALYITPKMLARAMTSKQGMDALAGLAKAQSHPKYGGAAAAKIAKNLNDSGILDFNELKQVDQFIHGQPEQQQQPQAPANALDYQF